MDDARAIEPSFVDGNILIGDVRRTLLSLPDRSVHCVVTSPPYWGLRDYGTAEWDGGDPSCPSHGNDTTDDRFTTNCAACGAVRTDNQLGLEKTPAAYVAELVAVFREVHRVLRDDGTVWLNIGDSYASFRDGKATPDTTRGDSTGTLVPKGRAANRSASTFAGTSIKHKDLVGIPWRVAFALQDDGWHLRQDIIWHKPNPMPESVTDRCTKSHEYIFLLTKSPKYFFDADAIKEPAIYAGDNRGARKDSRRGTIMSSTPSEYTTGEFRNKRSVWKVPTRAFRGAHFATFPPELIEPCILAGTSTGGCCATCGTPLARPDQPSGDWMFACHCGTTATTPCTVLDTFFGAGTTGVVAMRNGRRFIGCELNPDYAALAEQRLTDERVRLAHIAATAQQSLF